MNSEQAKVVPDEVQPESTLPKLIAKVVPVLTEAQFVPPIDPNYVRYGNYEDVKLIIASRKFFPLWITGLAGNGKTQMVEQACAEAGRGFIRLNFTMETDENDLLGGDKLVEMNGVTVSEFMEGPVITAMRLGLVLLLDEVDAGHTNKILCLQSVLEGKGVFLKRTGEWVKPTKGFQIFTTSNTKGRGSEDGSFLGTQIMNKAFLDRIAGMIFQDYPDEEVEKKILNNYFVEEMWGDYEDLSQIPVAQASIGKDFIENLCKWATAIRKIYASNGISEVVTTRTLINIVKAYSIFGNKRKAVTYACERYPDEAKETFVSMYNKLDVAPDLGDPKVVPDQEDEVHMDFAQQNF